MNQPLLDVPVAPGPCIHDLAPIVQKLADLAHCYHIWNLEHSACIAQQNPRRRYENIDVFYVPPSWKMIDCGVYRLQHAVELVGEV